MTILSMEKSNRKAIDAILGNELPQIARKKNAGADKPSIILGNACRYAEARRDKVQDCLNRKESNWFAAAARRFEKTIQKQIDNSKSKAPAKRSENQTPAFNKEKAKEKLLGLVHRQTLSVTDSLKVGPMTFVSPDAVKGSIRFQDGFSSYTTVDGGKIVVKSQVVTGELLLFSPEGSGSKQLQKARYLAKALGYLELPKNPEGLRGFYRPHFRGNF